MLAQIVNTHAMENAWINSRLKQLGKRKGKLADALGVQPARVTEIINGTRRVQGSEVLPLADFLEMDARQVSASLAKGDLVPVTDFEREVRLLGHVAAGDWRESYEWPHDEQVMIPIPPLKQEFQGLFALEVVGESMNLTVGPGSILICANVFHNENMEIEDGHLVIVERKDPKTGLMEATVKRYREIEGKHWLYAESNKPEYAAPIPLPGPNGDPDAAERNGVQIIARVVKAIVEL